MTTLVETPTTQVYRLTEALREPSRSASVLRPAPDEADFEELLLLKLGPRGWGRVTHFRQYYQPSWGEGSGKPLSPRALSAFRRFLQHAQFPKGRPPSVFLTDRGGLEVCWEDVAGKSVQVEFTSHGIEYYLEATESEVTTDYAEIPALAKTLTGV